MISSRGVGFQFVEKSDPLSSVWEPQERRLWNIVEVLRDSLSDNETRRLTARRKVKELCECADFNSYMVFIFTQMEFEYEAAPKKGELVLNKYASARSGALPLRVTVDDPVVVITAALGYFITTHSEIDLTQWPELLPRLGELLDLQDDRICEGTFGALHKICRNFANVMNARQPYNQLTVLVPKCLHFFQHDNPRVRYNAVAFIGLLFLNRTRAAMPQADAFVTSLLMLGFDNDCEVQKNLCRILAILLEYHVDCLVPHMCSIVQYIMIRMQDRNEDVALEARATLAFMAKSICKEALTPHFSNLVDILVQGTKYSDSATKRLEGVGPGTPGTLGSTWKARDDVNCGLVVSKKVADDNVFYEWNMRSRSAFALGAISTVFNEELLTLLLPRLMQMLQDKDWVIMESAIFLLGVITEGCMKDMHPYLPDLISLLRIPIRSDNAVVRSTVCWTLSRYFPWVLTKPQHLYLSPLVRQLLKWVLDDYEMVQEVACNALMTLEEQAKTSIVPYVDSILNTLHIAFLKYRRSRFYMLYNAIEILADSVGSEIIRREFMTYHIRLLTDERDDMADCQVNLFFLLRCLGTVAIALKSKFFPFHAAVADRCLRIAHLGRHGSFAQAIRMRYSTTPKKPFTIVALEALGGLAEGVGRYMDHFVLNSGICELMVECASDPVPEVRQATFYLLANLTRSCSNSISSNASSFLPLLVENLNPEITPLYNNAAWAIRELALTSTTNVEPHVSNISAKLVEIVDNPNPSESLRVSTALTIAYLCHAFPDKMAWPRHRFLAPCSSTLGKIPDSKVKDFALRALFKLVCARPCGNVRSFIEFLEGIISWLILQDDLTQGMNDLIRHHKEFYGATMLRRFCKKLPPALSRRVADTYDIL